jgi:hypothetical protein
MAAPSHATETKQNQRDQTRTVESDQLGRELAPAFGAQHSLLSLHRIIGNRAFDRALQSYLSVGTFADVGSDNNDQLSSPVAQPKGDINEPPSANEVLGYQGEMLDSKTRTDMESRFETNLSQVRIWTDSLAADSARIMRARAYTIGEDIVFAQGQYSPHTSRGRSLLTHELAHVMQWRNHRSVPRTNVSRDHAAEAEARKVATGEVKNPISSPGGLIQCSDMSDKVALADVIANPGTIAAVGFVKGFVEGAKSKIPDSAWTALRDKLNDPAELGQFIAGKTTGVPVGAAKDVVDLLKGIWELVKLGVEMSPTGIAYGELSALVHGTESPTVRRVKMVKEFLEGFYQFAVHVKNNPNFLFESGEGFGRIIGEEAGQWFSEDFVMSTPFDMGFKLGVIEGYIALEVAMLFLGPEELALKGISAAARAAKGTRLGQEVLRILEKIPALKKVLDAKRAAALAKEGSGVVKAEQELKAGTNLAEEGKQLEQSATKGIPEKTAPVSSPPTSKVETPKAPELPKEAQSPSKVEPSAKSSASPAKRADPKPFMNNALKNVSDSDHPLHNLVKPGKAGEGLDWNKTERITKGGKVQKGRYQGSETDPIVQAGHKDAHAARGKQEFMLEDADANQLSGQVIESKGAYSFKERVFVTKLDGSKGVWVERGSLEQWERLEVVPQGTLDRALKHPTTIEDLGK